MSYEKDHQGNPYTRRYHDICSHYRRNRVFLILRGVKKVIQGIFVIAVLMFCFYGIFCRNVSPAESEGLYSTELSNQIRQIQYINDQLQAVEELIIDIETSDSHHHKNVRLDWQTSYGKNLSADVWVDGDSIVTAQALALAEERERELTAALFREIDKLQTLRHKQNVSRTIVIHRRGEDRDDV